MWKHPELIQERLRPGAGWKLWDKIFMMTLVVLLTATLVIGTLHTGRFKWAPLLPAFVSIIAFAGYIIGQALFIWAKYTNRFFSSVVRIQKDRGHTVCQEGPYRFVRHPGYVGAIIFLTSTPFIMGSLWALIPTIILDIAVLVRGELEDAALQKELAGYAEYSKKVRYKLIPNIW
jgi:protein-S-isoprenylcysteine O-methyltransferase Ste14